MADFSTPPDPAFLTELLRLLTLPGIGPGRIRSLMGVFRHPALIRDAPTRQLLRIPGIDRKTILLLRQQPDEEAVRYQLRRLSEGDVRCISLWDETYPAPLKDIADPPLVLFCRGAFPEHWQNCVAVVGTRNPTGYGRSVTLELVRGLIRAGVAVVSGMARGIDSIAHECCIREGGITHAVLGCGVDRVYPAENRPLYRSIVQRGNLLSEFLLGTGPDAPNFPRRNRIISGLCRAVLVVEAGRKSGALITADYALDQNREVLAVPGNITVPQSEGPNYLISQGARMVCRGEDILEELQGLAGPVAPALPVLPDLPAQELEIWENLSRTPMHVDQLVLALDRSPAVILAALLRMELRGLVRQLSGKRFVRV